MSDSRSGDRVLTEIEIVQNPAFGALLLWKYGREYQDTLDRYPSNLLLYFLVLPVCLHWQTLDIANRTQAGSGLGKFCEKLGKNREEFLALHSRCLTLREMTFASIGFGVRARLFSVDYSLATLRALDTQAPRIVPRIKPHTKGAEKLGIWFRGLGLGNIFKALGVQP